MRIVSELANEWEENIIKIYCKLHEIMYNLNEKI